MAEETTTLFEFQCGKQTITVGRYIVDALGSYSFPRDESDSMRDTLAAGRIALAQHVFGGSPGIMLWPEPSEWTMTTAERAWFSGVLVWASCRALPVVRDKRDLVEHLIVMWHQKSHLVIPDPVILPRLEQIPWSRLARTICYD